MAREKEKARRAWRAFDTQNISSIADSLVAICMTYNLPKAKENQYTKMPIATHVGKPKKIIDTHADNLKSKSEVISELGFTQKQAERFQPLDEQIVKLIHRLYKFGGLRKGYH